MISVPTNVQSCITLLIKVNGKLAWWRAVLSLLLANRSNAFGEVEQCTHLWPTRDAPGCVYVGSHTCTCIMHWVVNSRCSSGPVTPWLGLVWFGLETGSLIGPELD